MKLPKFLHIRNDAVRLISGPIEMWINTEDISTIQITCVRTPKVEVRLRTPLEPGERIVVAGTEADCLIKTLKGKVRTAQGSKPSRDDPARS